MAIATDLTAHCSACGAEIPLEARANFCPRCGRIGEEAEVGDADGVVLALEDAVAWTEVATGDVAELTADVEGDSEPLYRQLNAVFDDRLDALRSLEATGGATGSAAWAAGEAQLDALGAESDDLICQIAGEMRGEGDDADAHITPAMGVEC